ncbi:hypothetical protein [Tenacibaculum halocynthiae]|uniref:hypothetical protein n=1 Tax=Tenacibaculum halocynthiae TaxID=1254437 RepID=UPI0038938E4B
MILTIKNNTIKKIASLFLMLFLIAPIVIKTIHHHHHENDTHIDCKTESTHLHQEIINDCDICYFSFSSFYSLNLNIQYFISTFYNTVKIDNYYFIKLTSVESLKKLRAPPYFI